MNRLHKKSEHLVIFFDLFRWTLLVVPIAACIGSSVALFLWLLDLATRLRWQNGWLLYFLPLAGVLIYWVYKSWGKNSVKGNNLLIENISSPGEGIPRRMGPLVLFSTLLTHLCGGSAGREGTAVQMGGSIAAGFSGWFRLSGKDKGVLLTAGMAAGFGAVFGTPLTGTVFALEVLTIGRIRYDALLPCLMASVAGDLACSAWGIHHTQYSILFRDHRSQGAWPIDLLLLAKVILAGICFGLTSFFFATLMHSLKTGFARIIRISWLVPVAGAFVIIALTAILGTNDYLGLGVTAPGSGFSPAQGGQGASGTFAGFGLSGLFRSTGISIVSAFREGGATPWSWLWKLLFTAITLGAGFKGGEVTPLFFIGATLGNTLSWLLGAPVDLFAGLGFIAVFAGATNTPLACTIMGVELFGGEHLLYFAVACFTAYFFSGHSGIYGAQTIDTPKIAGSWFSRDGSLEDATQRRKKFAGKQWGKLRERWSEWGVGKGGRKQ